MNKKSVLLAPVLAAALLGTPGLVSSAAAAPAATNAAVSSYVTDPVLSDSASLRLSNGKYASGFATYTRSTNKLTSTLHVTTPYLFVGARGTITATVYADTPFGPMPLWTVSQALTACGLWDPSCSSSPAQTWTNTPSYFDWQKVQQYATFVDVSVNVV